MFPMRICHGIPDVKIGLRREIAHVENHRLHPVWLNTLVISDVCINRLSATRKVEKQLINSKN